MSAEHIVAALEATRTGNTWMARCPAHPDDTPSLSIRGAPGGKVLVHCFAGCAQADVIAELKRRGLWTSGVRRFGADAPRTGAHAVNDEARKPHAGALSIWRTSAPASGTLVETYLVARGLTLPLPPTLRFHARLKHPSGECWPCMVALVARGSDDKPVAIHRTFLSRDGSAKAPVKPERMMLGPCRGGAVRLAAATSFVMVGEGIETCLAAMQATGDPAWATLSTAGLRALELPTSVRDVIALADGDAPGEAAARACARRWVREGRQVWIARPPQGMDFNDMLTAGAVKTPDGAR